MRKICLLGASGSIGTQTLDVMNKHSNDFSLVAFSVGSKTRKIASILKKNKDVKYVCMKDKNKLSYYSELYPQVKFFSGDEGLLKLINDDCDMVVNALVGFVGLKPTLYALEKDKIVCLANKEALVVGGELVNKLLNEGHGKLYPIDSEHSALTKCLMVDDNNVKKLMLTASGGAFRKLSLDELKNVTPEDALKHPTWKMGNKITIDCATMVNKAFEIIEAHYLFNYPYNKIGVTLHDESYVHSYVIYNNGMLRADVSKPDMRNPIRLALYEFKCDFSTVSVESLKAFKELHFHEFNPDRYPLVSYSEKVIKNKGIYGAIFNAANEVAVHTFLNHDIDKIVKNLMSNVHNIEHPTYDQLAEIDAKTRQKARELVKKWRISL